MVPLSISKLICSRSIIEFLQFWFVPFSCDGLMLDIDGQVRHAPSKSSKLIYQQLSLKPHHEQFTSPILRGYNDLTWHVSWLRIQIPQSWFPTGIITYNLYYMYIYILYICVCGTCPQLYTHIVQQHPGTPLDTLDAWEPHPVLFQERYLEVWPETDVKLATNRARPSDPTVLMTSAHHQIIWWIYNNILYTWLRILGCWLGHSSQKIYLKKQILVYPLVI